MFIMKIIELKYKIYNYNTYAFPKTPCHLNKNIILNSTNVLFAYFRIVTNILLYKVIFL